MVGISRFLTAFLYSIFGIYNSEHIHTQASYFLHKVLVAQKNEYFFYSTKDKIPKMTCTMSSNLCF